MKRFMVAIGILIIVAGCGTSGTETNGTTGEAISKEIKETTSSTYDVANFDTSLDIETTKDMVKFTTSFTNGGEPTKLTFSSGQKFELVVKDSEGNEVYRYSDDKMFTMALIMEKLEAGETITFTDGWDYSKDGKRVEAGEYSVNVTVLPIEINEMVVDKGTFFAHDSFILDANEENDDTVASENTAFRNIQSTGENGEYVITGEARVFEASFMYAVEDGHTELIKETPFQTNEGAPAWSTFELKVMIEKDQLPVNGTITAHIYERSAKDGAIVNSYYVPLEQFK